MTTRTAHQSSFRRISVAIALVVLPIAAIATFAAHGQRPLQSASAAKVAPTQKQEFEVASIRPLDPHAPRDIGGQAVRFPSNRFTLRTINLKGLVEIAYGIDKVSGGPDWVDTQPYSVDAKVEGDALLTQKQMQPLLQNLLEERFHLKVHRVQTNVSGYVLVVAQGGAKLQPTQGGPYLGSNGGCELKYQNDSVEGFGKAIGHWSLKMPVVDRTGLDGMYDFDLKFIPEDGPPSGDPNCSHAPDIFIAVQKQLGLKLVPQKVPVDSLVIDSAEKPTPN